MLQIVLLRHSKAVASSPAGDHARALSRRGEAEAKAAAAMLKRHLSPDFALVSDARRTRQTFDGLVTTLGCAIPHRFDNRLYDAAPEAILALVGEVPAEVKRLLVVSHNPGIGELARELARSGDAAAIRRLAAGFPTSAFAVIRLDGGTWAEAARGGALEDFATIES